jgi:serine/threonine protein kinase
MDKLKHIALKGKGYFCIVKQYADDSGNEFALKELKKEHFPNDNYRYRLNREISLLRDLQGCDNIIELLDSGQDIPNEKLWYLMPFAKQNLYDYIKRHNTAISKELRYELVQQIINAIKFAHQKGVLHRDISPNNVLVFEKDGIITLKVSDFGLGKDTESLSFYSGSSASGYGQILYVSPEQRVRLKDSTVQSDIYSLGKLVYFIFTGKDPDNLKQFELSSLVAKCIEDNPADRFSTINEFETHFASLRDLQLNQKIDIQHLTLEEILKSTGEIDWIKLHEILVKGNYIDHVYSDYISPVNELLLKKDNLQQYYSAVGNAIKDFVKTYAERLEECYQTVRWPFNEMETFGTVLIEIVKTINNEEVRLICFKQLWYLAYEADKWSVQKEIKAVFNDKFISPAIETQLAEFIIASETKVEMSLFSGLTLPKIIKSGIIKGNEIATDNEAQRNAKSIGTSYW